MENRSGTLLFHTLFFCLPFITQAQVTNSGNLQIHPNGTVAILGDYTNNGTFIATAGTVIFDGSAAQTLAGSSSTNFYNLVINNISATGLVLNGGAVSIANSLTLTDGFVYTSAGNLMNLADNASVSGASSSSYVIGPLQKTGNDAFTFPVGKAGFYMPISITAPNTITDVFTTEYFRVDPKIVYGSAIDLTLYKVTDNEYWTLVQNTGTSSENVTLEWTGNTSGIGNLSELRVTSWNGIQWDNLGNASTTGTTSDGTMLASIPTSNYTAFAFGTTTANNPLPIGLISFNAVLNGRQVDLDWSTATETNNDFFTIEKTRDGFNYEFVAKVDGAGNSTQKITYIETDFHPFDGISYYRLQQTDFDGKFTYSNLAAVNFEKLFEATIYPNPFNQSLTVTITNDILLWETELKLFNSFGMEVYDQILTESVTTLETSHFAQGVYYYRICSNNSEIASGKLICAE